MKYCSILLIGLFFIQCGKKETVDNDLRRLHLKGKVKSYWEAYYEVSQNNGMLDTAKPSSIRTTFFDEQGYISRIDYHSNFNIQNSYNEFEYDEERNLKKSTSYLPSGELLSTVSYTYNNQNKKTGMQSYNSNGELKYYEVYTYDKTGNFLERKNFSDNGRILETELFKYNEKGRCIELKEYGSKGKWEGTETYKYNEKGQVVEAIFHNGYSGNVDKRAYYYDKYENQILIGNNTENRYVSDTKDNWVQSTRMKDGLPKLIIERKIKYY
jgi:hypothetical protein